MLVARNNNWIANDANEGLDPDSEDQSPPDTSEIDTELPTEADENLTPEEVAAKEEFETEQEKWRNVPTDYFIAMEDINNDMSNLPKTATPGHFPDYFETGFSNLLWESNGLWTIEETGPEAPFDGKFSAYTDATRISENLRATLKVPIKSYNGGRVCFALFAQVGEYLESILSFR